MDKESKKKEWDYKTIILIFLCILFFLYLYFQSNQTLPIEKVVGGSEFIPYEKISSILKKF